MTDDKHITAKLLYDEIKELAKENKLDHGILRTHQIEQGERIVRIEGDIGTMRPKIDEACGKANEATGEVMQLKGQQKTWVIIAGFIAAGLIGAVIKWALG